MFERFTDRARKVFTLANQQAQRFNHEYIGTEHILFGLLKQEYGLGADILKSYDLDISRICQEAEKLFNAKSHKNDTDIDIMIILPMTRGAEKVIESAIEESKSLNHNYVGTEHILLGLLRETEGIAAKVLLNLGLKLKEVRQKVIDLPR